MRKFLIMETRYKIKLKNDAIRDFTQIHYYISKILVEPGIANRLIKKMLYDITILEYYPEAFQRIGNLNQMRRLIVKNYNILYSLDELRKKVFILHIYHKSKNIK